MSSSGGRGRTKLMNQVHRPNLVRYPRIPGARLREAALAVGAEVRFLGRKTEAPSARLDLELLEPLGCGQGDARLDAELLEVTGSRPHLVDSPGSVCTAS